jgi:phage terminase large subunit-like protein
MSADAERVDLDIIAAMNHRALFAPWFRGDSWDGWRSILKAAFGLPMSEQEREFFRSVAERDPPGKRVRELWIVAGRRAGKDSIASLITAYAAVFFDARERLRPGERALCACLACDRDQARIVLGYTKSYFERIAPLAGMIEREIVSGFELSNGVDVAISTNSFRNVRGRPILCAVLDELAFYSDEASANPDEELYRAIKPGMATLADDALLVAISTPYARRGLLYKKFKAHYGKDSDDVLVIRAPSIRCRDRNQ